MRRYRREVERARLGEALAEARAVQLVGPVGVGKTALARELTQTWEGPTRFLTLAELEAERGADADAVSLIAALAALIEREQLGRGGLVVLDEVELLPAAALPGLLECVHRNSGSPALLLVSRHRFAPVGRGWGGGGAHFVPLPSLRLAPLALDDALTLLADRLAEERLPLPPDEAALRELVARLDGLPLALEDAARQLRVLDLPTLLERSEELVSPLCLRLQRSETALPAELSEALTRLSHFHGELSPRVAEQALAELGSDPLALLLALQERSLVLSSAGPAGEPRATEEPGPEVSTGERRLRVLRVVRAYALAEATEATLARARRRHVEICAQGPAGTGAIELGADDQRSALDVWLADHATPRRAATLTSAELSMLTHLVARLADLANPPRPGDLDRVERAVALAEPLGGAAPHPTERTLRFALRSAWAQMLGAAGRLDESVAAHRALFHEAMEHADELRALEVEAAMGHALHQSFRMDEARAAFERVVERAVRLQRERAEAGVAPHLGPGVDPDVDPRAVAARARQRLSSVHGSYGAFDRAEALLEEAAIDAERSDDEVLLAEIEATLGTLALDRGDPALALLRYQRVRRRALRTGQLRLAAVVRGYEGFAEFALSATTDPLADHLALADRALREALAEARGLGFPRAQAAFSAALVATLARRGELADASALLPELFMLVDDDRAYRAVCEVWVSHLDLAEARRARELGESGRARARFLAVVKRASQARGARLTREGPLIREISDDLRIALALLVPSLDALRSELAPAEAEGRARRLLVGPDGERFRLDELPEVSLRKRPTLARLLWSLVSGQLAGATLDADALLEATWPGERLSGRRGKQRLYVALNDLRKRGLQDVLERAPTGYVLRAELVLVD